MVDHNAPFGMSSPGSDNDFNDDQIGGGLLGMDKGAADAPYYGGFFDDDDNMDEGSREDDGESTFEECSALH